MEEAGRWLRPFPSITSPKCVGGDRRFGPASSIGVRHALHETWTREAHDPRSDAVRSPGGPLLGLAAPPRIGLPVVIVGPGFQHPALTRVIMTTPVACIHRTRPEEPHAALEGWWDTPLDA